MTENEPQRAFQVKGHRTIIKNEDIYKLNPGDHIGWRRWYIIWHHAIVCTTDEKNNALHVIHFTKVKDNDETTWFCRKKKRIIKTKINITDGQDQLYRIEYEENVNKNNPPNVVLDRAYCALGNTDYHLLSNNCESFATYCKTGRRESCQQNWFYKKRLETVISTACKTIVEFVVPDVSSVWKSMLGPGPTIIIEIGFMVWDISRFYARKQDNLISQEDFEDIVKERILEALLGLILAIVGPILCKQMASFVGEYVGDAVKSECKNGLPLCQKVGNIVRTVLSHIFGKGLGIVIARLGSNKSTTSVKPI